jgi:hypothetical protein
MSLAKRIDALESRYKPKDAEREMREKGVTALCKALHASLPSDEPRRIQSPSYGHAIISDYKGCLSFEDKLRQLVKNIEDEVANEGDQEVLNNFPQWALDAADMTAEEYLHIVHDFICRI